MNLLANSLVVSPKVAVRAMKSHHQDRLYVIATESTWEQFFQALDLSHGRITKSL